MGGGGAVPHPSHAARRDDIGASTRQRLQQPRALEVRSPRRPLLLQPAEPLPVRSSAWARRSRTRKVRTLHAALGADYIHLGESVSVVAMGRVFALSLDARGFIRHRADPAPSPFTEPSETVVGRARISGSSRRASA
jgi:hypothetical protein